MHEYIYIYIYDNQPRLSCAVVSEGSSSGGFGLACPAHCSSSITLLSDVFLSGFGCGALIVLLWIYWAFFSSHPPSLSLPGLDLPISCI